MRTTVADALPSDQTADTSGNLVSGVADVKFVGDTLYAIEAGAGCSHGYGCGEILRPIAAATGVGVAVIALTKCGDRREHQREGDESGADVHGVLSIERDLNRRWLGSQPVGINPDSGRMSYTCGEPV